MPLVLAHRGASHHYPPNTLDAFRAALTLGADGVELDVRLTADDVAVVHHDAALPSGQVIRQITYAELPAWVPSLDAALGACDGLRLVNIEIKNPEGEPDHDPSCPAAAVVADLVAARGMGERVVVSSFDEAGLARVRDCSELPTALLVLEPSDEAIARAVDGGHGALNPWFGLLGPGRVQALREAGLGVHPWTVDQPDHLTSMVRLGVDSIITNRPDRARAIVDGAR
jgi:glycerophosphoryl diester phosphodiesterase